MSKCYSKQAKFWDCFFGDRSPEINFWARLASRYGNKILAPMAATGEVAGALSRRGFNVTAIDSCAEMVKQGQCRVKETKSMAFLKDDITALALKEDDFDFAFLGTGDFHHFTNPSKQRAVLKGIHRHLNSEGCLALELFSPLSTAELKSRKIIRRESKRFAPLRPPRNRHVKLWKEGATHVYYQKRLLLIPQKIFMQMRGETERYSYVLRLRLFARGEIFKLMDTSGYKVKAEYGSYSFKAWTPKSPRWLVVMEKK